MTQRERQILRWIEENPMISQQELAERAGITRSSVGVHISNLMRKGAIIGKGYILPDESYAAVVGGANIDLGGISAAKLIPEDSNPGQVRMSLGGVGRNIAHNMTLLGLDTHLLTVLGEDLFAQRIEASCSELGIDISRSLRIPGGVTSSYLFVSGPDGNMVEAISDMDIYRHLTPAVLTERLSFLNKAQVLVLDTNLPAESIAWLCEHAEVPIFADPVSAAKAEKLRGQLGRLHTLKPNRLETEILSGVKIRDERSLHRAADVLLSTGLQRVFITLREKGVLAADQQSRVLLPSLAGSATNTTGSGDAFTAALVWSYLRDFDLERSAIAGLAAAAIACECLDTINPALSEDLLQKKINDSYMNIM